MLQIRHRGRRVDCPSHPWTCGWAWLPCVCWHCLHCLCVHLSLQGSTSLLIQYFNQPDGTAFTELKYTEYFKWFMLYKYNEGDTLHDNKFLEQTIPGCWQKVSPCVGTKVAWLLMISLTSGELFYIQCLLIHCPAQSSVNLCIIVLYSLSPSTSKTPQDPSPSFSPPHPPPLTLTPSDPSWH